MLLSLNFYILFFCLISLFFLPKSKSLLIKNIALFSTSSVLILSCFLLNFFHLNYYYFQDLVTFKVGLDFLNLYLVFGLDGLSIYFFSRRD